MPKKPTENIDPILHEEPTITIADREYTVRRLGLRDVFRVSRILGRGVALLGDQAQTLSGSQVVQVLVASLTSNEDEVLKLIADVLSVQRAELDDPAVFPMDCIVDILEALAAHQDLRAFFARVQTLTERLPELQTTMTRTP